MRSFNAGLAVFRCLFIMMLILSTSVFISSYSPKSQIIIETNAESTEGSSVNGTAKVQSLQCNCVIFRMDDIADFRKDLAIKVMDIFIAKNQSLNLSLVPSDLGSNETLISKLAEGHQKGLFELLAHTWGPGTFNGTGLDAQKNRMVLITQKMQDIFGRSTNVFVPPNAPFDNDSLEAMKELGLKIISSEGHVDKHPFYVANGSDIKDSYGVYHVPTTAKFHDYATSPGRQVPTQEILEKIKDSISQYGWAVTVVHPQDFLMMSGTGKPVPGTMNESALNDLGILIDTLVSNHVKITTFSKLLNIDLPPIADKHPPIMTGLSDIVSVVPAENKGLQKTSLGTPKVTDFVDPSPIVTNNAPSDGFAIGTTSLVKWTAKDSSGNTATTLQYVTLSYAKDEFPPNVVMTTPSKEEAFTGQDTDKSLTVHVAGFTSDKQSGVKQIEVRTIMGKKFTPFVLATPQTLPNSNSNSPADWSRWNASLTFDLPGRYEIITKATDYFGNKKIIVTPITIDFGGRNMTKTSLKIDPLPNPVLGGTITISGMLAYTNVNGSDIGLANQFITFGQSKPLFPDVTTGSDGRFSSTADLPKSGGMTFSDLQIQTHYPGDGVRYRPSDSDIIRYGCTSALQVSFCTVSGK